MKSPGRTLALSFGTTVAMWAVAYLAMMKPGFVLGEALFAILLVCPALGGWIAASFAARHNESPIWSAAKVGLGAATLNLLIVGSLLIDPKSHALHRYALAWITGNFAASVGLAMIGGAAALRAPWPRANRQAQPIAIDHAGRINDELRCTECGYRLNTLAPTADCPECNTPIQQSIAARLAHPNWFNVFTIVAAATVFLLLITGGLVTGLEAGLAVPDWPNSFGHNMLLYPLAEMRGGIYYEHAHRLYGMLVGVTAIALVAGSFFFDKRGWLRALAIAYLIMVCTQGIMGGTRVTELSRTLAIAHGVFGQVVFATIVAIAAFTSTTWRNSPRESNSPALGSGYSTDRKLAIALVALFIVQLALGATYRHLRREWNTPPEPLHPLYTHMVVALLVTVLAIIVGGRAWAGSGGFRGKPVVPVLGQILIALVGGQLVLGIAATIAVWFRTAEQHIPILEVVITTAHQATGALLLATATLLMVWILRLLPRTSATIPAGAAT